jgi:iron(III) transport system permease protein
MAEALSLELGVQKRSRARRLGKPALWSAALFLILIFMIIYPIGMLLLGAVTVGNPATEGLQLGSASLSNFVEVVRDPTILTALSNSLIIGISSTILSLIIGLLFAWIVARTNTPFKKLVETAGLTPLFLPPLVGAVAWSILGSPTTGLINTSLKAAGLDLRINLYTMPGIIFVFGIYYAPYVYMFVLASLKNMDPALEEAAQMSGAGHLRTMATVTFPLIAPALVSAGLLTFIITLGIYGIPAVLGNPSKISVLTTYIYVLTSWSPPLYNRAAAASCLLIIVTAVAVVAQRRIISGRSYVTVSGKSFKPKQIDLGPWRWLTLAFSVLYMLVVVVLPYLALLVGAFRKYMFIPSLSSLFDLRQYSVMHFARLGEMDLVWRSIWNTLEVGAMAAIIGGALSFAIGYTITRSNAPGRGVLDIVTTIPVAVPGIVIGVGYLWAWIGLPGGLWGTTLILALALVARFLPDTVKMLGASFLQIHKELEEASWIAGGSILQTIWRVVAPLTRPGIVSAMTLLVVLAVRELGSSLFLFTNQTIVMSVLLLDFYEGGNAGGTAAFSILQSVLLMILVGGGALAGLGVARLSSASPSSGMAAST